MFGVLGRQSLCQVVQSSLAGAVDVIGRFTSAEAPETRRTNELTLQQSAFSNAFGVGVSSSQQAREGQESEVRTSNVSTDNFAGILIRCLVPQLLLQFGNSLLCRPGIHAGDLPKIAGIGDEKIDERRLLFNCRRCGLQ